MSQLHVECKWETLSEHTSHLSTIIIINKVSINDNYWLYRLFSNKL